jgi:predicted component of viral defense system (DUF524 family)
MKTITIYHDPIQNLAHILYCEVNDETGEHKVITSQLQVALRSDSLAELVRYYNLIADAVRVFEMKEVSF